MRPSSLFHKTQAALSALVVAGVLWTLCGSASAQNSGFQINRYEPTAPGEFSFWVDHPWYSKTRYFAGGLTLNYAHNPLVYGLVNDSGNFVQSQQVIAHQLIGHIDLAGSFLDRVLISASLPVVFLERGERSLDGSVTPAAGVAVGDPRVGFLIRIWGQPYKDAFSISAGGHVWIPLRKFTDSLPAQSSDQEFRGLPKIVLGGIYKRFMWSTTLGFLIRPEAVLGSLSDPVGRSAGNELQLGVAALYADMNRRFAVGPELVLATALSGNAFQLFYTSLEALLGVHYNVASQLQLGLAGGLGLLRQPGTPDGRLLFRIAYAPMAKPAPPDRDHDGIPDDHDQCPDEHKGDNPDPEKLGCPQRDRDGDGVLDAQDKCPDEPKGANPDPDKLGCPQRDRDGDGVLDAQDKCPDEPKGANPDPEKLGCPQRDRDGDGVLDAQDQCPDQPKGAHPDPERLGCPDGDRDGDGVYDHDDQCPTQPAGEFPDPARRGCPLPDRDKDTVVDLFDACPDKPGAPNPDPKKNGCPGLVEVKGGQIVIIKPVFFATNKDVILKKSFPVLNSVIDALKASPQIKKVRVEGHTDDKGKEEYNIDLSGRRASSVMKYLIEHGIAADRLQAQGYGPKRPIADNKNEAGRAKNRRVDFVIVDPAQAEGVKTEAPAEATVPESPDQSDKSSKAQQDQGQKDETDAKAGKRKHHRKGHKDDAEAGDSADKEPSKKAKRKKGHAESADDKPEGDKPEADKPEAGKKDGQKAEKKSHHRKKSASPAEAGASKP